jgi:trimeric autotransporter adhesin
MLISRLIKRHIAGMMKKLFLLSVFYLLIFGTHAQIITTIAGGGTSGLGDGGPAIDCELNQPYSTALDVAGNLYIADAGNNRIRKVSTSGIITTIAGTGIQGYSGDDSAATNAKLNSPGGVAVDVAGNIYISDTYNARIRKVSTSGIITTIAGTGIYGYSGNNGPATAAELYDPQGIVLDSYGNLYVCDEMNNCIRKITSSGIITTTVGTGLPGYSGNGGPATDAEINRPYGIALDAFGNIYISEWTNNCIRKINTFGTISIIAGTTGRGYNGDGIMGTNAELNNPIGIAVDNNGSVYVADGYNDRVRKINSEGIISTIAGNGSTGFNGDGGQATLATIGATGVTLDNSGNIYISDFGNGRIRYIGNSVFVNTINLSDNAITIVPNPCKNEFTINVSSEIVEDAKISLIDITGREIGSFIIATNQDKKIILDVSSGLYLLNITTLSGSKTEKLIISK